MFQNIVPIFFDFQILNLQNKGYTTFVENFLEMRMDFPGMAKESQKNLHIIFFTGEKPDITHNLLSTNKIILIIVFYQSKILRV